MNVLPVFRALDDEELQEQIRRLQRIAESLNPGASPAAARLQRSYQDALDAAIAEQTRRATV